MNEISFEEIEHVEAPRLHAFSDAPEDDAGIKVEAWVEPRLLRYVERRDDQNQEDERVKDLHHTNPPNG